ncbi:MAG: c-type cytochrome [Caulobacteraceae bacterium]
MSKPLLAAVTALALTASALPSIAANPGDAARGQTLFNQRCGTCHTVVAGATKPMGPNVRGMLGRRAGTVAGFRYSAAMRAAAFTWDAAGLDAYLAAPTRKLPGTSMLVSVPQAQDRADLIAFLAAQK